MNYFDRVVTEEGDIDPGYFLMLCAGVIVLGAIPSAILLCLLSVILSEDHSADLVGLAGVIAAAGVAYGGAATGAAIFRRSGQPVVPPKPSPVSISDAGGVQMNVPADKIIDTARGVEPQPTKGRKRGR